MVDSGNYREKREKTLENLAKKLSSQVIRTGRSVTLEPMNPYERRVIHATIQGIDGVTSSAIGEEPSRRVVISSTNPVKKNYHRDRSAESGERGERSRDRGSRGGRGGRSGRGGYEKRPPREKYVPQDVTPNRTKVEVELSLIHISLPVLEYHFHHIFAFGCFVPSFFPPNRILVRSKRLSLIHI